MEDGTEYSLVTLRLATHLSARFTQAGLTTFLLSRLLSRLHATPKLLFPSHSSQATPPESPILPQTTPQGASLPRHYIAWDGWDGHFPGLVREEQIGKAHAAGVGGIRLDGAGRERMK